MADLYKSSEVLYYELYHSPTLFERENGDSSQVITTQTQKASFLFPGRRSHIAGEMKLPIVDSSSATRNVRVSDHRRHVFHEKL